MKTPRLILLCLIFTTAQNAAAMGPNTLKGPMSFIEVLNEVLVMRPVGLVATIVGTTLFLATSPFTGIASAAEPHDAFRKAGDALVVGPAAFTFSRPFGVYGYNPKGVYPERRPD
ncbi:hypothetical protein [Methylococcus capsulatus]|jgi:hypothetical protein|nr:hypothetical protein [Methylococcus capsulatus]QXP88430.1 hypothetical protein KW112_04680 [Methylococcus capsulatus]QXP90219.1 hypothetical protein KW114_14405 [Methylococcus capsulatus]QXP94553.1 hypothetical protein KW113_05040 [Methylococcus capsulatus]UQN13475.1 hypothetical protein M3M30_06405 [Methylococcus capsulatus]CAI8746009.1 conserved exported protein of unknown function [Methylococcus capsulatus]